MSTVLRKSQDETPGYLKDLIDNVDPHWHSEFMCFVETGEANEAFLAYLDENESAQSAVEGAFKRQAAKFEELATELKRRHVESTTEAQAASPASATSATSTRLAAVVENALQANSSERADVVATGTAALAASMPAEDAAVVTQVTRSLESNLARVARAAER